MSFPDSHMSLSGRARLFHNDWKLWRTSQTINLSPNSSVPSPIKHLNKETRTLINDKLYSIYASSDPELLLAPEHRPVERPSGWLRKNWQHTWRWNRQLHQHVQRNLKKLVKIVPVKLPQTPNLWASMGTFISMGQFQPVLSLCWSPTVKSIFIYSFTPVLWKQMDAKIRQVGLPFISHVLATQWGLESISWEVISTPFR